MPVPEGVLKYLINGIEGSPLVMTTLLQDLSADDPRWDNRADPDRFTLREMVAHFADWDPIFLRRVERTRDEINPNLQSVDEGVLCHERGYDTQNPIENLDRLVKSRPALVSLLRSLSPEDWDRPAYRELVGDVTMFQLLTMIIGHDTYHTRQAAEFLAR